MSAKNLLITVAAILMAYDGWCQQDSTKMSTLNEVIVTATKGSIKPSQTGKIVTVIDQQTISRNAGRTLNELLNTQPGFFLNGTNNTPGTNIDAYFRGAGTGNLLIVIDGIPVYDPSQTNNSFDLNSIPLEQIDRIEILRGGQSTLWGSDAVAGVVQLFLKKESRKPVALTGSASYGTYNTLRTAIGLGGSFHKFNYSVQYNHAQSDGISSAYDSTGKANFDKDGFAQNNVQASLQFQPNEHVRLKAFGNFSAYHNGLDQAAFIDDKDFAAKNRNNMGALSMVVHDDGFSWSTVVSYEEAKRSFVDDSADRSTIYYAYAAQHYRGNTVTAESFGNLHLGQNIQLTSGIQYIHQNTHQSYNSVGDYPYSSELGGDSAHINQFSAYASLLVTDWRRLNFEAGSRVNHHSIYGYNATYTINPSINFSSWGKAFFNVSSAYKIPSLYQLYSEYGNKGLKPESSVTYELGIETRAAGQKSFLRVAGFIRDTRNLIIFFTDPNTFASQYVNRDRQHDKGIEIESNINFSNFLYWNANFTYVEGQGIQDKEKLNNLFRRPNAIFNSMLVWKPLRSITLSPTIRVIGKRLKGPYDIGPDKLPSYYTIDLLASYGFSHVKLFAQLQNVTNQQYVDVVGYTTKKFNMMAGISIDL